MKEHFSAYGDISWVEVEVDESEVEGTNASAATFNTSARISFTTRRSAEKAFLHGKSWQGHKLQYIWLTSNNSGKECAANSGNLSASNSQKVDDDLGTEQSENLDKEADAADDGDDEQGNKDANSTKKT